MRSYLNSLFSLSFCIVFFSLEGDASYDQFIQEKAFVISDLKKKSKVVSDFLNSVEGITCPEVRYYKHFHENNASS